MPYIGFKPLCTFGVDAEAGEVYKKAEFGFIKGFPLPRDKSSSLPEHNLKTIPDICKAPQNPEHYNPGQGRHKPERYQMDAVLNAFLAYFVIVDPIGVTLIFNALTNGKSESYRRKMAVRSVCLSTVLILCFGFWGRALLEVLGIQMESFKIAGGLLIFYAAFGLITKSDSVDQEQTVTEQDDISVFPLSIPMIAGPGSLTLTILLFSQAAESNNSFTPLVIAVILIYVFTLVCFLMSKVIARVMGETINNILKRLLGVLLASLAIQFIADGIKALMG